MSLGKETGFNCQNMTNQGQFKVFGCFREVSFALNNREFWTHGILEKGIPLNLLQRKPGFFKFIFILKYFNIRVTYNLTITFKANSVSSQPFHDKTQTRESCNLKFNSLSVLRKK